MAGKDSNKDFSEFFKLFKKKGKDENTAEDDAEAKAAAKKAAAQRVKNLKMLSGIWKQSKITAGATKVVSNATKTILSKWKILAGLALFAMPKEFWGKLRDGVFQLWNFLKEVDWKRIIDDAFKGLKVAIETLVPVIKWIGKKIFGEKASDTDISEQEKLIKSMGTEDKMNKKSNIFGREESDEDWKKRKAREEARLKSMKAGEFQGGLLGNNREWTDVATGLGLIAAFLAPGSTFALGLTVLKGGVKALTTILKMGGGSILTGPVAAIGAFIAGAGHAINEGMKGADLAKEWKVDEIDGFIGGLIGTTEKGITGMWKNALGKGALGAGAGFMIGGPVGALVGGLLGASFGAVTGYIGGERIAKWVNATKKATVEAWDKTINAIDDMTTSLLKAILWEDEAKLVRNKAERILDAKQTAVGAQTEEQQEYREETLEQNINKQEGGARHYKDLKKKLEMTESDYDTLFNRTNLTGDDYATLDSLRKQKVRLMEQIKNQEDWEKQQKKDSTKRVMTTDGFGIHFDKKQTRASSWTGQTDMTKNKMATLASMFKGGLDVTSGWRSKERGNEAMLGSTSDFHNVYSKKTMKGITDFGQPNSKERKAAIIQMRKNGFQSQHEHGRAIDFTYPYGYSEKTFPQLEKVIKGVFPGAFLKKENDHLHMSFSDKTLPNQSGIALQQLQAQNNSLSGMGSGSSTTVIAPQTTKVSQSSTTAVMSTPNAQDAIWEKT
jgi:hypothetical protein